MQVTDEEFSFIPVGGPMPCRDQAITAFGAAANLVHPATGYSITRMLEESGPLADSMAATLQRQRPVHESAAEVWDALWPQEKRRQVRKLLIVGLPHTSCVTCIFEVPLLRKDCQCAAPGVSRVRWQHSPW